MPHFPNFGDDRLSVQPEKDGFGSFEPRQEKLQEAFADDQLTGLKGGQEGEELLPTDSDFNDVLIGVKEKVGGFRECSALFTTGGGGDSLTENGGFDQVRGNDLEGQAFLREQFRYQCNLDWNFEPAAGMDFAGSLNPVLELGGTAGPGATSFMTGSMGSPTDNFVGNPYPSPIG